MMPTFFQKNASTNIRAFFLILVAFNLFGSCNPSSPEPVGLSQVDEYFILAAEDANEIQWLRYHNSSFELKGIVKTSIDGSNHKNFDHPSGLSVIGNFVFVADQGNRRIVKIDADGRRSVQERFFNDINTGGYPHDILFHNNRLYVLLTRIFINNKYDGELFMYVMDIQLDIVKVISLDFLSRGMNRNAHPPTPTRLVYTNNKYYMAILGWNGKSYLVSFLESALNDNLVDLQEISIEDQTENAQTGIHVGVNDSGELIVWKFHTSNFSGILKYRGQETNLSCESMTSFILPELNENKFILVGTDNLSITDTKLKKPEIKYTPGGTFLIKYKTIFPPTPNKMLFLLNSCEGPTKDWHKLNMKEDAWESTSLPIHKYSTGYDDIYYRYWFTIDNDSGKQIKMKVISDDGAEVYVNENYLGWLVPQFYCHIEGTINEVPYFVGINRSIGFTEISQYLKTGRNMIAVNVTNGRETSMYLDLRFEKK